MITAESLIQLKAFARQDGFILAIVWIASMWMIFQSPQSSWGPLLMLSTPFYVGWRLTSFRNYALDGVISFRRAMAFSCYVFFYASLVFALGQFVYFKYLDNGMFLQLINESLTMLRPFYQQQGVSTQDLDIASKTLSMMKPGDLTFFFMTYNLIIGACVSPVISLLCKRQK